MALRKTGIDAIGDIPWGTHISLMYNPCEDFLFVLIPYIVQGLANNELCLWIYSSEKDYEKIKDALSRQVSDLNGVLSKGQLLLIPYTQWYIHDGSFIDIRVNNRWTDLINSAVNNGFDGLRAVADTSWLDRSYYRTFFEYENKINNIIIDLPFLVVCLYDTSKISISESADIINNHAYNLVNENGDLKVLKNVELQVKNMQLEKNRQKISELERNIVKQAEILNEALEYDRLKTDFFCNLSHEFRTPLNVILSAIQLINVMKKDINDKERKYLKLMKQNCYRLLRLVSNIIDITRIESDYFELSLCNCNIVKLIENITLSVMPYAETKGISLQFDTNVKEKVMACDLEQMERVILNLLSNAVKFTPSGGLIRVSIIDRDSNIAIIIGDNGIGIPDNKQDIVFKRFQRVNKSLSRDHEGSGIGLSLVKSLVEKHGGTISLKSTVGKGSVFTLEFPCHVLTVSQSTPATSSLNFIEKASIEFSDFYV